MQHHTHHKNVQASIENVLFSYLTAITQGKKPILSVPNHKQLLTFHTSQSLSPVMSQLSNVNATDMNININSSHQILTPDDNTLDNTTLDSQLNLSPHTSITNDYRNTAVKRKRGRPSATSTSTSTSTSISSAPSLLHPKGQLGSLSDQDDINDEEFEFRSLLYSTQEPSQQSRTSSSPGPPRSSYSFKHPTSASTIVSTPGFTQSKLTLSSKIHHTRILLFFQFILQHLSNHTSTAIQLTSTLREIYYRNQLHFHSLYFPLQQIMNATISEIASMLMVNREDLGIVSAAKGLVYGNLQIIIASSGSSQDPALLTPRLATFSKVPKHQHNSITIDCSIAPQIISEHLSSSYDLSHVNMFPRSSSFLSKSIHPLPPSTQSTTESAPQSIQFPTILYKSTAKYIIVCEKDGIFQTIQQHYQFIRINAQPQGDFILISGNGYPSLAVRRLTFRLASQLNIPIIGFFDPNPHGINIFLQYSFGSFSSFHHFQQLQNYHSHHHNRHHSQHHNQHSLRQNPNLNPNRFDTNQLVSLQLLDDPIPGPGQRRGNGNEVEAGNAYDGIDTLKSINPSPVSPNTTVFSPKNPVLTTSNQNQQLLQQHFLPHNPFAVTNMRFGGLSLATIYFSPCTQTNIASAGFSSESLTTLQSDSIFTSSQLDSMKYTRQPLTSRDISMLNRLSLLFRLSSAPLTSPFSSTSGDLSSVLLSTLSDQAIKHIRDNVAMALHCTFKFELQTISSSAPKLFIQYIIRQIEHCIAPIFLHEYR